jgi:hypothetical protein
MTTNLNLEQRVVTPCLGAIFVTSLQAPERKKKFNLVTGVQLMAD